MKIHYFQRYHGKENVETANTMLMLSRLYNYNPDKFFGMLNNLLFKESETPELSFELQASGKNSVPDAVIKQPSFRIVVETKLRNQFNEQQLINHINSFNDENFMVLLTLDPRPMKAELKNIVDEKIKQRNSKVIHINLTFKQLINAMEDIVDDRDLEILDVLEDFKQYCIDEELIPNSEKWMRVIVARTSFSLNMEYDMYYDNSNRGFSEFGYLGLFKDKSVRAIGKIADIITASYNNDKLECKSKYNKPISSEIIKKIEEVIKEADTIGHNLKNGEHNFFVVEKFHETDFFKSTKYSIQKAKYFDLTKIWKNENLPETKEIAEYLKGKSWESVNY